MFIHENPQRMIGFQAMTQAFQYSDRENSSV